MAFVAAAAAAGPVLAQHRHGDHLVAERIADGLSDGYQIVIVDLNNDGRPDLLPVASGLEELAWFENPDWLRHRMTDGLTRPENVAAYDIDRDGIPEVALVSGFSQSPSRSTGIVMVLTHRGEPTAAWEAREIDRLPTSHRVRWVDIDGSGNRVLVNAPLLSAAAEPPDQRADNPVVLYRPGLWEREVIGISAGLVHGLAVSNPDGRGRESILTAGFGGVFADAFDEGRWSRQRILSGDPSPWPFSGASEIAELSLAGERQFVTIEPWHGNQVVSYRRAGNGWSRTVVDASIGLGHTVMGVDFDAAGSDVLVVADRGEDRKGVYLYSWLGAAGGTGQWMRETLDAGMQASGCAAGDLDGDGRIDLVCIGRATEELTWYRNIPVDESPGG